MMVASAGTTAEITCTKTNKRQKTKQLQIETNSKKVGNQKKNKTWVTKKTKLVAQRAN